MERSPVIIVCLLFVLLSACKPKEWTSPSRTTPNVLAATPIWVNVLVTSRTNNFQAPENFVFEQRFATLSGHISTYTEKDLLFTLTPRGNGDHTISIAATLRENTAPVTDIPEITVVDGRETVHQVGRYRFTFLATTDPRFFPIIEPETPDYSRIDGNYSEPPPRRGVTSLLLHRGRVTVKGGWADRGRYTIHDESVLLSFGGANLNLTHVVVDDVHVLLDKESDFGRYFVRIPKELEGDQDWWEKLLKAHPQFAKALPHSRAGFPDRSPTPPTFVP
ncbi:hypothetical protein [Chthoniobacter flavus]|uniref:hypothetical protein n=1 Tax=Chthoniobacter flavus TaxID=191863 RepID=UPI00104E7A71|nr:hypothetical protein [Chthoniobacter flavus]